MIRIFNISYRRVGGIRFLKLGRLNISFSLSARYKPIKGTKHHVNREPLLLTYQPETRRGQ